VLKQLRRSSISASLTYLDARNLSSSVSDSWPAKPRKPSSEYSNFGGVESDCVKALIPFSAAETSFCLILTIYWPDTTVAADSTWSKGAARVVERNAR
jgi:hypothetical protein